MAWKNSLNASTTRHLNGHALKDIVPATFSPENKNGKDILISEMQEFFTQHDYRRTSPLTVWILRRYAVGYAEIKARPKEIDVHVISGTVCHLILN